MTAGSAPLPDGNHTDRNRVIGTRVLPSSVAQTETGMLETVLEYGTGKAAAIGQFAAGKTGTTSNYGDAWFVGWDSKYTVAVWVGYPEKLVPMTNDFDGGPVLGGTFPALIWHDFMTSALQIDANREAASKNGSSPSSPQTTGAPETPSSSPTSGSGSTKASGKATKPTTGTQRRRTSPSPNAEHAQATPEPTPTPAPSHEAPSTPTPTPAPRHRRAALRRAGRKPAAPAPPAAPAGRRCEVPAPAEALRHWRPRARDVRVPGDGETPGQLDGVGDAHAGPHEDPRIRPVRRRRQHPHRAVGQVGIVVGRARSPSPG